MPKNKLDKEMLNIILLAGIIFLSIWVLFLELPMLDAALGAAGNQTLNTTVNITNAAPLVRKVVTPSTLDLEAYGNVSLQCNVTVYDYDNNTASVNATFYFNSVGSNATDNLNNHYTNSSCTRVTIKNNEENYTCVFNNIAFFANNGTWYCNATAYDDVGANLSNISNPTIINPLLAIYVPGILDFGQLAYNNISDDKLANITNAGNRPVNISVQGWGSTKGDGLAMNCSHGNINVKYARYNITSNVNWQNAYQLNSSDTLISGFYIPKRTNETADSTNTTYWRLKIPPIAGGICSGKLLFTASAYGS